MLNDKNEKVSIELDDEMKKYLEILAKEQRISLLEAIRRAIATEVYIKKEITKGSKILIQSADKTIKEVLFR